MKLNSELDIKVIFLPYWVDSLMKQHKVSPLLLARSNNLEPLLSLLTDDERKFYQSQIEELIGLKRGSSSTDPMQAFLSSVSLIKVSEDTVQYRPAYGPNDINPPKITMEQPVWSVVDPTPYVGHEAYVGDLETPHAKHVLAPIFDKVGENTLVIRFAHKHIHEVEGTNYNSELLTEIIKNVLAYVDFEEFSKSKLFRVFALRKLLKLN